MKAVLDEQIVVYRTQIAQSVDDLYELTESIGHNALTSTINDLKVRIHEPYMFVIVGEVKAGKSSFINALLETKEDICKVAPSPMTDTIQQIVYGHPEREEIINPYLKKIYHPAEILKEIAIVDTPGTNTIIEHHQEITERFVPGSDLIVFVFEAKNPYRQSSWDFFKYINDEWRKKIIFILQQKDLMNEADLAINFAGVEKYAKERGISAPKVFAVSAKMEQEGDREHSGYLPLRAYIANHITGGKAIILKMESNINTATNIADKIQTGLDLRKEQYRVDVAFRDDISKTLDTQAQLSEDQVNVLIENLLAFYDQNTRQKSDELSRVLSFGAVFKRSIKSIFSRNESIKEWLNQFSKDLEKDLNSGLRDRLNERVIDLAESIQQMGQIIDLKIRNSRTILKNDNEIFSDIAERRSKVLTELRDTFSKFLKETENFKDEKTFVDQQNMSPTLATGSGIALVGVILAAVANGVVFDITGGILTTIGLGFASISLGIQKRKILRNFNQEITNGRTQLEKDVRVRLNLYIQYIRDRIESNFTKFDLLLSHEKGELDRLFSAHAKIYERLKSLDKELQKLK